MTVVGGLAVAPCDELARALFERWARERWGLSDRQAAVVFHLCRGVTYHPDLARLLGMGEQTLKNHLTYIHRRLEVANSTGVVIAAWPVFARAHRRDRMEAA